MLHVAYPKESFFINLEKSVTYVPGTKCYPCLGKGNSFLSNSTNYYSLAAARAASFASN